MTTPSHQGAVTGWKTDRPTKPCHLTKWGVTMQLRRAGCQLRGREIQDQTGHVLPQKASGHSSPAAGVTQRQAQRAQGRHRVYWTSRAELEFLNRAGGFPGGRKAGRKWKGKEGSLVGLEDTAETATGQASLCCRPGPAGAGLRLSGTQEPLPAHVRSPLSTGLELSQAPGQQPGGLCHLRLRRVPSALGSAARMPARSSPRAWTQPAPRGSPVAVASSAFNGNPRSSAPSFVLSR